MERVFALYDSDVFYATRFMEYFKKKKDFQFELSIFTQKGSFEEFLSLHQVEILLVDEQIATEDIPMENIKFIYKLSENPQKERHSETPNIFKYQPVKSVMYELLKDYNRKVSDALIVFNPKQVNLISVFSPKQNSETLSFTWSISSMMSEQKKVLLVMLDLLQVQLFSSIDNRNYSLTEFIYYLKENNDIITKMKGLLCFLDNLSYLSGASHSEDILSLKKEDIQKWVEELKLHTDYQTIIFYLGCYSEATIELMKWSNLVLLTSTGTAYENSLKEVWAQQMERSGINLNQNKFKNVELQREDLGQIPISMTELMKSSAWSSAEQSIHCMEIEGA